MFHFAPSFLPCLCLSHLWFSGALVSPAVSAPRTLLHAVACLSPRVLFRYASRHLSTLGYRYLRVRSTKTKPSHFGSPHGQQAVIRNAIHLRVPLQETATMAIDATTDGSKEAGMTSSSAQQAAEKTIMDTPDLPDPDKSQQSQQQTDEESQNEGLKTPSTRSKLQSFLLMTSLCVCLLSSPAHHRDTCH